jgi:serine/threonine protein kinase
MVTCTCGADVEFGVAAASLCPACLIRLALDPAHADTDLGLGEEHARLLGPIGRGPYGEVFLAFRPDDHPQLVTVKRFNPLGDQFDVPRFCERVREISNRIQSIAGRGLPAFLEAGVTADDRVCVIAPYVQGQAIATFVATHRVSPAWRSHLLVRLCTLVEDLHQHGLVHGSLKASNVIVTDRTDGASLSLLDVGLVPAIEVSRATGTGTVPGIHDDLRALEALVAETLDGTGVDLHLGDSSARSSAGEVARMLTTLTKP